MNGYKKKTKMDEIHELEIQLRDSESRCVEMGKKNAECWDKINALEKTVETLEKERKIIIEHNAAMALKLYAP